MALTGILFWFFGFFYCLYYFFFGKYGLNTNNQANISRKRQFSNVFRSGMNKENHALLFGHRGGGIQRNANNAFRPDTRDPDRVVSYAQFVWKKEILLDYLVRILLWITVKSKLFPRSHVVWHFQMFTHCRLIRFF